MAIKRVVSTEFWTDTKVIDMFSPEDKLFFLYLMTNPHTTQLGVYQISKKMMAFEIGYSLEAISVLIDRFENKYQLIKYSAETSEIAIRNYLKHSIVKGGKPVEDLLAKEISEVKDTSLLKYVHDSLADAKDLNVSVLKIIPLLNDNDNDNDNENEYSSPYSALKGNESSKSASKRFTPPTLEEVSNYCIERRNDIDPERFIDFYESKGWMVGKNKMKDWKAAVRSWEKRDKKENKFDYIDRWGQQ